jgi:hypothetical protein
MKCYVMSASKFRMIPKITASKFYDLKGFYISWFGKVMGIYWKVKV